MSLLVDKVDVSLKYTKHYNNAKELLLKDSSKVLNEKRNQAFHDFVAQGIPTRKNEEYKFTNLHPYFAIDFQFIHQKIKSEADLKSIFRCNIPQLDTHLAFLFNGWFYEKNRESTELPEGVVLDSLEHVANERPEFVAKYYATIAKTSTDPLVALNTAFAKDGYSLYVPKNVAIEKPLQLINLLQAERDSFVTQRNLVVIEPGAQVSLIICDHTLNANKYLSNTVTEIFVGANATLDLYTLQNEHNNATCLNSVFVHQNRDSNLTTHTTSLHGGLIRNNLEIVLDGENAEANLFGMAFSDKNQHVDNHTQVIHAKPNCQSNQVYKNVLDDESTGAFSGRIHVIRNAQKTNAFQRNNNLLLTDKATMHTKPQLIIDADDVKCSHGASVGQIDEEALFYLRARGIDEDKARLMMMNAFAHEVVQEIKIEPLRERIDELVDERLKGEVARCHDCVYYCEC
ncbi:MAG: Fe-S cluster assembly protein SufD [Prolixibacteraceae bacterium]|nr:Fe-S cluster assembly protein SufD [Prolixibacteraceae bacterium]